MKIHLSTITITVLSTLLISCDEDVKNTNEKEENTSVKVLSRECPEYVSKNKKNNLNISILLDLSDRIEKGNQTQKDSAYLSSLVRTFLMHVKTKQLIFLEDRLQLFFNPVPSNTKINGIAENLSVIFTKNTSKDYIQQVQDRYDALPSQLYDLAKKDAENSKRYPGSDIWRFFEHDVKDYCISDCHRNILVIITDGYMYHEKTNMQKGNRTSYLTPKSLSKLSLNKSDWKNEIDKKDVGFIPATSNLNDLEVLVIGIKSENKNAYAEDIVEAYWNKWLLEMDVEEFNIKIKNADIGKNIEKVINDFILGKVLR